MSSQCGNPTQYKRVLWCDNMAHHQSASKKKTWLYVSHDCYTLWQFMQTEARMHVSNFEFLNTCWDLSWSMLGNGVSSLRPLAPSLHMTVIALCVQTPRGILFHVPIYDDIDVDLHIYTFCSEYSCMIYVLICYCFNHLGTQHAGILGKIQIVICSVLCIRDLMQVINHGYIRQPTKASSPHGNKLWMFGKHQSVASVGKKINLARRDHMWPLYLSRSISDRIRKPCENCYCYLLIVPDLF